MAVRTNARTIRVSTISPTPMVTPIWALLSRLLPASHLAAAIVYAYDNGVVAPR
jgi:hypothetical protein